MKCYENRCSSKNDTTFQVQNVEKFSGDASLKWTNSNFKCWNSLFHFLLRCFLSWYLCLIKKIITSEKSCDVRMPNCGNLLRSAQKTCFKSLPSYTVPKNTGKQLANYLGTLVSHTPTRELFGCENSSRVRLTGACLEPYPRAVIGRENHMAWSAAWKLL